MGKRKQVRILKTGKAYLFPVEKLSTVFQAKFISAINKRSLQERSFNLELKKTNWAVYAKEPFGGPEQVEEYLGRYMRKTAISNHRLLSIDENGVRFKYHNYRDSRQKQMLLWEGEFLRRFCQHILPGGYVRIRHYGLLSATKRAQLLQVQKNLDFFIIIL